MTSLRPDSAEDLFVVEAGENSCYLYAPLRRAVVLMNRAAVGSVSQFLSRPDAPLAPADAQVIDQLRLAGLFSSPAPEPPTAPRDYVFRPHEVTLFPTTRCNLRCIYCYANAGTRCTDMPWEVARAAIDFVIENARAVGRQDFIVGFHGGGEPTAHWRILRQATLYARRRAQELGLEVKVHCATNGVLSRSQRDFIVANLTGLNISLDGPADIQDRQRPLANGKGSFTRVVETITHLKEARFPFGIRVTLTAHEAARLTEIVRFIRELCPKLDQLHVEPVWQCGRCQTTGERPPAEGDFVACFAEAQELAQELGFSLFYSGARLDVLVDKFCAAPGDGFSVTPEGLVSSCFEVTDPKDPRAALFHYGHYDPARGAFAFDDQRLACLRRLRVENIDHCRDCFCKWHCAGDCLAKALPAADPAEHNGSPRCRLNREITRLQLQRVVARAAAASAPTDVRGA